jgi:hypothetical protein
MPKAHQKLIWKDKNKKEKYHNYIRDIFDLFWFAGSAENICGFFKEKKYYESSYKKDIYTG